MSFGGLYFDLNEIWKKKPGILARLRKLSDMKLFGVERAAGPQTGRILGRVRAGKRRDNHVDPVAFLDEMRGLADRDVGIAFAASWPPDLAELVEAARGEFHVVFIVVIGA